LILCTVHGELSHLKVGSFEPFKKILSHQMKDYVVNRHHILGHSFLIPLNRWYYQSTVVFFDGSSEQLH